MKKILLSSIALFVATLLFSVNAENFIFSGNVNGWPANADNLDQKYVFKPGDTPDTWVLTDLGVFYWVSDVNNNNRFKIVECSNSSNWLSPNTTTMEANKDYPLLSGSDAGFNLPESRYINKITITKKEGNYFMSYEYSRALFVYGDQIAGKECWDFSAPTGTVLVERFDEELQRNLFYGHIIMAASVKDGSGKCFWRIVEKPSQEGHFHWGFNANGDAQQEQASFEARKGSCNNYVTEPEQDKLYTLYQIKFFTDDNVLGTVLVRNLGSYTDIPAGVEGVDKATAKVVGGQGEIRVEGVVGQFAVYSYSGALVATGSEAVSVPAGMYIVLVDGVATKVVVR